MRSSEKMHAVGHHLQKEAVSHGCSEDYRDAFARAAFNRYYYSAYLAARELLNAIDPEKWKTISHTDVPKVMLGEVTKGLKLRFNRARRLDDSDAQLELKQALKASRQLAEILTDGYASRVAADYEPEILVVFERETRFSLSSVNISSAHQWEQSIRTLSHSVQKAWTSNDI